MSIKITDLELPEREATKILSILQANAMPARLPTNDYQGSYNCWGFVAYYLQWEEKAYWMDAGQMNAYLKIRTNPISREEVKAGDVAAFYSGRYLTHTAIILDNGNVVCHKPGGHALCINTIAAAKSSYGTVTYYRVVEKVKKEFDNLPECVNVGV